LGGVAGILLAVLDGEEEYPGFDVIGMDDSLLLIPLLLLLSLLLLLLLLIGLATAAVAQKQH
jgi:hypothetical protein